MISALGASLVYSMIRQPTAAERQGARPPAVSMAIFCFGIGDSKFPRPSYKTNSSNASHGRFGL